MFGPHLIQCLQISFLGSNPKTGASGAGVSASAATPSAAAGSAGASSATGAGVSSSTSASSHISQRVLCSQKSQCNFLFITKFLFIITTHNPALEHDPPNWERKKNVCIVWSFEYNCHLRPLAWLLASRFISLWPHLAVASACPLPMMLCQYIDHAFYR